MKQPYRLFILGDSHINPEEESLWTQEIIPDINALNLDRVLLLGDLTAGLECGSAKGTQRAVEIFSNLKAPWKSIIGNHDLQNVGFETDDAAVAMMLDALGRSQPGWVIDEDAFSIIGLDNTYWRRNTVNKNEIVVDAAQQDWWKVELARLQGKPIIMLCHTPPIGSGLMVMNELHARVGNAYTNQNQRPSDIQQVIWEHPGILFWFSGHNHLGQHYRSAASRRMDVQYLHTGTASRMSSRDGCRHSRILEIGAQEIRIRTFDHTLRAIDPSLDIVDARSLQEIVENRQRIAGRRYVPSDPTTMNQPLRTSLKRVARFAFLSDAHSIEKLAPIQKRIAGWCAQSIIQQDVDEVILGGDITHQAHTAQAQAFLTDCRISKIPILYLPGNNEGTKFTFPEGITPITGCQKSTTSERTWFLSTCNRVDAEAATQALLTELPKDGSCLVFAHFPPMLAGEECLQQLQASSAVIHWVCGHRHRSESSITGNLHVTICAGLDPIKASHSLPEVRLIDWDGSQIKIDSLRVPEKFLNVPGRGPLNAIGLAFRGEADVLLRLGIEQNVPALQFHYAFSGHAPRPEDVVLCQEYRKRVPEGFLSIHFPNFEHPEEGLDFADQEPSLQFAEGMKLDDFTIHLPKVAEAKLYARDQSFQKTPWAEQCIETYVALSERALKLGAQISFENVYNKHRGEPGEERLSSRPWHLSRFVEEVRRRLIAKGYSEAQTKRVGIIFDAGHAFADVWVAKEHGLVDWLVQVAPYLQLSHIHQVKDKLDGSGRRNHQVIDAAFGPRINFYGLLCAFRDVASKPFPLLIEVRDQSAVLESYATLAEMGLSRTYVAV